jgi:N-methylhydantoinase A
MEELDRLRIGVDIGGTFTDFSVMSASGRVFQYKQDTTPDDPARAIELGLDGVAAELGLSTQAMLERTALFVHGTTVATNGVIQRNGPKVGLVCTAGFRDVLYFRDGFKPERFNIHMEHPREFVDRYLRLGVAGRLLADGSERVPLDEAAVLAAAERFRAAGVGGVAVAMLWSVVNPAHELRTAELLESALPGVPVLCSHQILPEIREWERTSATVLSAYIQPLVRDYLRRLETLLAARGLRTPLLVMQIIGGCGTVADVLRRPVDILHSGPAAAPSAAAWIAESVGERDLITVDMGGTSLDVCMITDGRASMSRRLQVEHQPIGVAGVEVHSIGAGGGSIAWIDSGGALRVGPRSAGSVPGPACYGNGGTDATVTDANLVLGYLDPSAFLAGRRVLQAQPAEQAVAAVGAPLGLDVDEAAAGIIRIVNANMVGSIRAVSIEQGIDPRGFTLVSGGGAGGLHVAGLARQIGMRRVLVPREAGTLCAFGMTVTDVRQDRIGALHSLSVALDPERVRELFAALDGDARAQLHEGGFADEQIDVFYSVDARYPGQVHELSVPLTGAVLDEDLLAETVRQFHAEHQRLFSYSRPELPVEFLHWRLSAVGRLPLATPTRREVGERVEVVARGERMAWFDAAGGRVPTAVHMVEDLASGAVVHGPAVIQAPTTTVVVPPGDVLLARGDGSLLIEIGVPALTGSVR